MSFWQVEILSQIFLRMLEKKNSKEQEERQKDTILERGY